MENVKEKDFLSILGKKGTIDVLRFLEEHSTARYKHLQQFVSTHTLNARIKDLIHLDLIQHKFVKEELRKEWYELTERGRKVLQCLDELRKIIEE